MSCRGLLITMEARTEPRKRKFSHCLVYNLRKVLGFFSLCFLFVVKWLVGPLFLPGTRTLYLQRIWLLALEPCWRQFGRPPPRSGTYARDSLAWDFVLHHWPLRWSYFSKLWSLWCFLAAALKQSKQSPAAAVCINLWDFDQEKKWIIFFSWNLRVPKGNTTVCSHFFFFLIKFHHALKLRRPYKKQKLRLWEFILSKLWPSMTTR
jgi:hypothetical protein